MLALEIAIAILDDRNCHSGMDNSPMTAFFSDDMPFICIYSCRKRRWHIRNLQETAKLLAISQKDDRFFSWTNPDALPAESASNV